MIIMTKWFSVCAGTLLHTLLHRPPLHTPQHTSKAVWVVLSILFWSSLTMALMSALALSKSSGLLLCKRRCSSCDRSVSSMLEGALRGAATTRRGPMYTGSVLRRKSSYKRTVAPYTIVGDYLPLTLSFLPPYNGHPRTLLCIGGKDDIKSIYAMRTCLIF